MPARRWSCACPRKHRDGFLEYLHETGVGDTSGTPGFLGAQRLERDLEGDAVEITLVTYWERLEAIKGFAGEDIEAARPYPEDERFEIVPERMVRHYRVLEQGFV